MKRGRAGKRKSWKLVVLLAFMASASGCDRHVEPASGPIRLTEVEALRNAHDTWTATSLPDSWREHADQSSRDAWYRRRVTVSEAHLPLAIYLPRVSMNAAVYINSQEIGSGGSFGEPLSRQHGYPQFFRVPRDLIEPGKPFELKLRVSDKPWALGYLAPIYIGDAATLAAMYHARSFWWVQIPQALAILMLFFAVIAFALYARRRAELYYFWFGAAMLLFAVDTLNVFVTDIPVERKTWELYVQGIVFAFAIATIIFIHRFTRVGWRWMEPLLGVILLAKILVLAALDTRWFYTTATVFNLVVIGYGLILAWLVVRHYVKTRSFETGASALAGTILLGFAVHTTLVQAGLIDPENLHIIHYAAPGFFLAISFFLVRRFLMALDKAEALAHELDLRVQAKEKELAATYEALNQVNQQRALSEERARIMREVHDGFGGQLVGALALLEDDAVNREALAGYIRESLLDLRVMIDSLDPNTREVAVALGMLRSRVTPILKSKSIDLAWDLSGLPDDFVLRPNETLNLLRVLQELLTNVVKHSRADRLRLSAVREEREGHPVIVIRLWENGSGFGSEVRVGKGLRNIRKRMQDLGGELVYQRQADGFETSIFISASRPI